MRKYFEQFREILEAVVVTDKNTGREEGYGFALLPEPIGSRDLLKEKKIPKKHHIRENKEKTKALLEMRSTQNTSNMGRSKHIL
ncbi:hypothetical protein MRB53_033120 [Persea americana]|uniref:Uncharacterized protein n=1 Tax=Persea americana TaxID=3435 RepID=A0ACC2KUB6_PERAE|nr:hypothetical protein MRB53_033120 [Persea americana]